MNSMMLLDDNNMHQLDVQLKHHKIIFYYSKKNIIIYTGCDTSTKFGCSFKRVINEFTPLTINCEL